MTRSLHAVWSATQPLKDPHMAWDVDSGASDDAFNTDTRRDTRLGFWVLVVGLGLFLAWAAWAPLDEGVVAPATVHVELRRRTIQHLQGGVIRAVKVQEGAEVQAGDVLLELDDGSSRAAHESARQTYLAQRAKEARLVAEEAGATDATQIRFHADLFAVDDPQAAQHRNVQQRLFASRRAAQQAELAALHQSIAGLETQMAGFKEMLSSRRSQQAIQARQAADLKTLAADGYVPRMQLMQFEQTQAELRATVADLEASSLRAKSAISEARMRIAQRRQEMLKEVGVELAEVRREVQANQEKMAAMASDLGRTLVRAPVAGQVLALQVNGVGGVVTPGQKLMEILPRGDALTLEAKLPPQVIDRVKLGDEADVRFRSFAHAPQLVLRGKVVALAGDAVSETVGNAVQSHYVARLALTPEGVQALGSRVMQPGMVAEVLIKTGERSFLTYLLHPLLKRVAASLTEE